MTHKLTVLIPCKDERRNIRDCIDSVRSIADEILVADSGSTDGTLEIVQRMPDVRVIEREYIDDASFKKWSIPQATHNWVLAIDADERVSPELAEDIERVLAGEPRHDAYTMPQRTYFLGHPIRYSGWSSRKLRLFRKDVCQPRETRIHPGIEVPTGNVGRLSGRLIHYTLWTIDDFIRKTPYYCRWAAEDLHDRGRRARLSDLTLRPMLRFFRHYVWQLGFLDGVPGLIVAWLMAYTVFLKYARLWAMRNQIAQPDPDTNFNGQHGENSIRWEAA
jgi:glycosyltransferase involved in cell wall biosynthesis